MYISIWEYLDILCTFSISVDMFIQSLFLCESYVSNIPHVLTFEQYKTLTLFIDFQYNSVPSLRTMDAAISEALQEQVMKSFK